MIDWRIHRVATTGSTNEDVMKAAEAGAAQGYVVVAGQQLAGRGRQGRVWHSPEGNLYASVLLKPAIPVSEWPTYSFVAALAVYTAVRKALPQADITLKWPNDVLVSGKKISGILIETTDDALVIGIGVNVRHYPSDVLYPCTSICAEGNGQIDSEMALGELLPALAHWHDLRQTQGFAPVREAWLQHAKQGIMQVKLPQSDDMLSGAMQGLDMQGNLVLRQNDGQDRLISTGDVLGFI